jgi:hypothetical protein
VLLIAELGVAVLLLSAGAIAFRQSRRERLSTKRVFPVCVVLGLLVGGYLSVGLVWQMEKTRLFGAPLTAVVFQLSESGYWEDYVGPLTFPFAVVNFAVGFFLPHLGAWVWTRLHSRLAAPTNAS